MNRHQRFSLVLIPILMVILVLSFPAKAKAGDAPVARGNMGYYGVKNDDVELVSEVANIKVVGDTASVTCRLTLCNHGPTQTIEIGFPEVTGSTTAELHDFTSCKNGVMMPVQRHHSLPARVPGIGNAYYQAWYTSRFVMGAGEKCDIFHSYQVKVPIDDIGGRLVSYSLLPSALWQGSVKTVSVTVTVDGYKPYYNLVLPREAGYVPLTLFPEGRFTFQAQKIEPQHNFNVYYQMRGPDLTVYRLQMEAGEEQLAELIGRKKYQEALNRIKALSPGLLAQNRLSEDKLHLLLADLLLKTENSRKAAEELDAVRKHDAVWAYYSMLTSLNNKRQDLAGQIYRSLDELDDPGFTKASSVLLKRWAQSQIKEFLSQPTAPVPQGVAKQHNRARLLIITVGLLSLASALLTFLRIRKKKTN